MNAPLCVDPSPSVCAMFTLTFVYTNTHGPRYSDLTSFVKTHKPNEAEYTSYVQPMWLRIRGFMDQMERPDAERITVDWDAKRVA